MKVTQVPLDIWQAFAGFGLMIDQKMVYLYCRQNERLINHGLYSIRLSTIARDLEMRRDDVIRCLQVLSGLGLIMWDNEVLYVPTISREVNFRRYTYRAKMIVRTLRELGTARSETGGPNAAVVAWLGDHQDLLQELLPEELDEVLTPELRAAIGMTGEGMGRGADTFEKNGHPSHTPPTPLPYPSPDSQKNGYPPSYFSKSLDTPTPLGNPSHTPPPPLPHPSQTPPAPPPVLCSSSSSNSQSTIQTEKGVRGKNSDAPAGDDAGGWPDDETEPTETTPPTIPAEAPPATAAASGAGQGIELTIATEEHP